MAAFYRTQYVPGNMTLVVSGDINSGEILNEIVRLYTKPASLSTKPSAILGFPNDFRFDAVRAVSTLHLFLALGSAWKGGDFRALEVLSDLGGESSVLSSRSDQKKPFWDRRQQSPIRVCHYRFMQQSKRQYRSQRNCDSTELEPRTEEPTEVEMERNSALERSQGAEIAREGERLHFEQLGD
jgi:hypothetical protein